MMRLRGGSSTVCLPAGFHSYLSRPVSGERALSYCSTTQVPSTRTTVMTDEYRLHDRKTFLSKIAKSSTKSVRKEKSKRDAGCINVNYCPRRSVASMLYRTAVPRKCQVRVLLQSPNPRADRSKTFLKLQNQKHTIHRFENKSEGATCSCCIEFLVLTAPTLRDPCRVAWIVRRPVTQTR